MAASVDGKTCSSPAEMLFRSRVLRTFLYNQGVEAYPGGISGPGFFKPRPPRAVSSSDDKGGKTKQPAVSSAAATTVRASTAAPGVMLGGSWSTPVLAQPALLPFHSAETRVSSAVEHKARNGSAWGRLGVASRRVSPRSQRSVPGSATSRRSPRDTASSIASDEDLCPAASPLLRRPSRTPVPRNAEPIKARRRRPLYDFFSEDDPLFMPFDEEPDDPRVLLPAHRIGDALPEEIEPKKNNMIKDMIKPAPKASPERGKRKPGSKPAKGSKPSFQVAAKRLPLHAAPAPAPASTHGAFAGSDSPDVDPPSSAGSPLNDSAGSSRWAENSPSRPQRAKLSRRRDIVWKSDDEEDDEDEDVEQVDVSSIPESLVYQDEDILPE